VTVLLLDASVVLSAFDPDDDRHQAARSLLADDSVSLATLDLARYEVANVAVRSWRRPRAALRLLETIERLGQDGGVVASNQSLLARATELAEEHEISVHDATYVAAVETGDRRLVSCDRRDLVSKGLAALP
jgi:predicted nucleic acid-binding protein